MVEVKEAKNTYLAQYEQFERELNGDPPWLRRIRKAAIARFGELGFPSARNEDWKFTNVAPLARTSFERIGLGKAKKQELFHSEADLPDGPRLVFVNGQLLPGVLSREGVPEDVFVGSLSHALETEPDLVECYLARYARHEEHPFTALNTAFLKEAAVICLPRGKVLEKPIHVVFVAAIPGNGHFVLYPRLLVVAGENSQLTLVEHHVAAAQGTYFTNAVTEIVAGPSAVVEHCKLQRESPEAFHIAATQIHQDRGSKVTSHYIGLGGSLVRNEVRVLLDGEGCEATVNGLYMATGMQHMDNFTAIDHAKPHCASHELYKGILGGKAHGVFNGKILVRQDAQKTDAKQTNQTLLLSDEATINTKPQLEIFADDVKCTHGATVGQLDAEALFYLQTRGIGEQEARSLLTYAFANDIVSRIKVEAIRDQLERHLLQAQHMSNGRAAKEAV